MLPNFLVIGAPRSGTTWIDQNLRRHPDIFMPQIKELHFFDRDYDRGIEFYESYFTSHQGQRAIGEVTPGYLAGAFSGNDVPALIFQHLPDARLVACLRNPVERAYSRYWNSKARFDNNLSLSFEKKLADRPEFINEGFYVDHLERYLRYFPRSRILILLYEQISADPVGFMQEIYRFIGVNDSFVSGLETARINAASGKGHLAKSNLLALVSRSLYRMKFSGWANRLRQFNSIALPPMDCEVREKLLTIYRDKNRRLQNLIEQDISHWMD